MDPLAAGALGMSVISGSIAGAAYFTGRREKREALAAERHTDAYLEMQAGLTEQREMIDLYRMENTRQAATIASQAASIAAQAASLTQLQVQLVSCDAKAQAALRAHADCEATVADLESRVHASEARISELGG